MVKSTLLRHPQFFHTLVSGFHTHLVIPVDFFSKYIQEKSVEDTVELKSDSSDMTWKVKMTGQRLSDGWEDFAVSNNLQIGDVLLVRYEGDLVFHVSDLGPNCSETRDIAPPSSNNDDDDNMEFHRKKKLRKNCSEGEAGSSSSSDNSCFVATVTASSLRTDTLYLPQHFTSANGLTTKCCKIVLIDGGERSWALDLSFNNSSDTFYISRGWRNFCYENGQEEGGVFMFKIVGSGETLVLSSCPTESSNDRKQRDCSEASGRESISTKVNCEEENIEMENSEDECSSMESLLVVEKMEYSRKRTVSSYSSYSPCHKRLVTFTLPPDYIRIRRLNLPVPFLRENNINKPGKIYLLGKNGTKCLTSLLLNMRGAMSLGKGWKGFVKANGIKTSFTLKLIWEDTTPMFSLCDAESTIDREQEDLSKTSETESSFIDSSNRDKINKYEINKEESRSWERNKNDLRRRDSTPSSQKQFVTFTITPSSFTKCRLILPAGFARENSMDKPGMICLVGKDGTKWQTTLLRDKKGTMGLGKGWIDFGEAHDLKAGESFTMELTWEDETPLLSWCCRESSSSKANEKESVSTEPRGIDSSSAIQNQFVTLALAPEDVKACQLHLPSQFMKANGISKLGKITLLGENGMEWSGYLLTKDGTVALGKGWDEFCEANGVKSGEPFTLEFLNKPWEVKVEEDGQKLTDGWKEFALAHDLRVGDIAVFRQERDMVFHVTLLGPSCCEIQYESCLNNEKNLERYFLFFLREDSEKEVKKNPKRETKSSCFVANVSPATLSYYSLVLQY
ncbi:hypothetical protein AALP_AA6G267300 [Arabis alpina]|uniref:TF-B3 domain-containing protein n=1 Tax=Arabis alpina TaxID=50452 RepID=A0A087GRW8_ARAAL|nr:hypothetical protein AALP_AA6G267300 [Arabis alpina]